MGPPQCLVIEVRQSIDKRGDQRWPEVTEKADVGSSFLNFSINEWLFFF